MHGLIDLIRPDLLPEWMHPAFLHDLWIDWRVRYPGPPVEFLAACFLSLLLPGRWLKPFFLPASVLALYFYFGVAFAGGLVVGATGLWLLTELLARWSARSRSPGLPVFTGALLIHAATVWLFWQPLPGVSYLTRDESMGKGELWLFCGIAFTVLRAVLYVWQACRRPQAPRRLDHCLFYILFFPLFRMGPIMGPDETLQAIAECPRRRNPGLVGRGIGWFILGNIKLLVGGYVIEVYFRTFFSPGSRPLLPEFFAPTTQAPCWQYWLGALCFHLRIYCIFSGYADLARGMCNIIGMTTPDNFYRPFLSPSIAAMWRRWHCTFGLWLRHLIYIPLGGDQKHPRLNSFVTFLYAGAWHFPFINSLVFAAINTVALATEQVFGSWWQRQRARQLMLYRLLKRLTVADGLLGRGLRIFYTNMVISTAGACVFDFNYGGIYLLRGMFGLQALG